VTQVAIGIDSISHSLLQLGCFRETFFGGSAEEHVSREADFEDATLAWDQRNLTQVFAERAEQLLRDPCSAQEPTALRAVFDFDPRALGDCGHV
jgi:hypothetical protein